MTAAEYPLAAANAVGNADVAVDSGSTGPMPWQDQSYHFNRNVAGGPDLRLVHFQEHFDRAKAACFSYNPDDPETAARELGTALHPLQDWVAHADHGIFHVGALWHVHNFDSPQRDFGSLGNCPDDPMLDAISADGRATVGTLHVVSRGYDWAVYRRGTKRLQLTAELTIARLKEFRAGVLACKCKKFFGTSGM